MAIQEEHLQNGEQEIEPKRKEFITIEGISIQEWFKQLSVDLPEDPTATDIKRISSKIVKSMGEVLNYSLRARYEQAKAEHLLSAHKARAFKEISESFEKDGKKPPAHGTMETLAQEMIVKQSETLKKAAFKREFWQSILQYLIECRKAVKSVGILVFADMDISKEGENHWQ